MKKIIIFLCIVLSTQVLYSRPTVEHLNTGSFEQRIKAIKYFGKIKYKKVFWILVKYLNKEFKDKKLELWSIQFRSHAAEALGRLQDNRAIDHLVNRYKIEKNVKVKQSIVYGLSFYKHKNIIPILNVALLSKNVELKLEALHTAAQIADETFANKVQSIKQVTREYKIYLAACYTLVKCKKDTTLNFKQIQKGLKKSDPEYRFLSAYYLKKIGDISAMKIIEKALEIENYYWVRKEMKDALAYLNDKRKKQIEKKRKVRLFLK